MMLRLAILALPLTLCAATGNDVFSLVKQNCSGCHNAKVKNGDIDLASLNTAGSFDHDRLIWEKVAEKLKTGQMPPPGIPKPPAERSKAVIEFLEAEFARQDRTAKPDPGRVTARRLNRAEYNNTLRDLLGIDLRPADNFPADQAAFGFDNVSDALSLPPTLLEKYLDAAGRTLRSALFGPAKLKPSATHYSSPVRLNVLRGTKMSIPVGHDYDLTGLSTLHSMHVLHRFPADAEYSFRIVLNGHRPNQSEPAHPAFWIDGKLIKEFEVDATDLEGQIVEVRTRVTAGEHLLSASYLRNFHGLPPSYGGPAPSQRPPEPLISSRGKLSEKDIEVLRKLGTRIKTDGTETRIDNRFESIDVGGPFHQDLRPSAEARKRVFVCAAKTPECERQILTTFARRAFRRPVAATEVQKYASIAALARKQGESFEESVVTALEAILVAPQFLYRLEKDRPGASAVRVDGYELASRLSYFLWSSMPDDELLNVAPRLTQPAVLRAQVQRMLKDAKSHALVEEFAGQWLQFRNIDIARPDLEKFREFDDGLRQAMRRETEHFLASIIRNDASVLDMLDANYTFLNERLARFYGIRGVSGPDFRRVDMTRTQRGGGLLAQASILTTSSYSTRTSPVLRGKWILENILNSPPPPPPPSVPALDDTKAGLSGTLRTQMEQHRVNPACASCHSRMDPLGFGLENFNAIGAWRKEDGKFPIDASGQMADGRAWRDGQGLKAILKSENAAFERGLTEKLLIYALGRGLERYDRPVLTSIAARLPANGHRFSELVYGIVESLPFQNRRPAASR